MADTLENVPVYERIYAVVRQIPVGRVATYGQIAEIVGGCTARRRLRLRLDLHGHPSGPHRPASRRRVRRGCRRPGFGRGGRVAAAARAVGVGRTDTLPRQVAAARRGGKLEAARCRAAARWLSR